MDHGELPPGLDARPPPPLSTAPVAADGWAVATLPGEVLFARTNARLQDYVRARSGSNQLCGCVIDGELHVTSYRVVFHPIGCGSVPSFASQSTDWEMPVRALTACSLKVENGHKLSFKCKDGQRRVFTCAPRDGSAALACARAVHALAFSSASDAFARVCCGVLSVPSWWNLAACAPSTRRHSRAERSILTRPRAGLQSRLHRGPRVRPSFTENISLFPTGRVR